MALFVNSVVIAAPRERVFDYIAERENEREWNPECKSVEKVSDGLIDVGSRWRAQWKGSPMMEVETTEYDRPNHMTNHSPGALEVTVTFTCGPVDDGTRLDVAFYAQPHGAMRLMFPLFERRFRKRSAENIRRIKDVLEAPDSLSADPARRPSGQHRDDRGHGSDGWRPGRGRAGALPRDGADA